MRNLLLFLPLFMAIFLIGCVAFIGCGSDEVELPIAELYEPATLPVYFKDVAPLSPQLSWVYLTYGESSGNLQTFDITTSSEPLIVRAYRSGTTTLLPDIPVKFYVDPEVSEYASVSPESGITDENGEVQTTLTVDLVGNYAVNVAIDENNQGIVGNRFAFLLYAREGVQEDPIDEEPKPPQTPPIVQSSVLPPTPPQTPLTPQTEPGEPTGYVVWVEKRNQGYSSGIIHSDFVFINFDDETITFTGADGRVDQDDPVRAYVKVEYGYTYDEASDRAPLILREMDD